jgi:O-antigen/teichoic acid export membrane protein
MPAKGSTHVVTSIAFSALMPSHDADVHSPLSRTEVRRRTSAGIVYVASSGLAGMVIGFFGNLVLARLLTPHAFGLVAVGSTMTLLGGALAEGGLGSGMIRRAEPPDRSELRTLNGIQLTIALSVCVPTAAVALPFGVVGAVTAIMVMSLPIETLQTPGRVVLNRAMKYDRMAAANVGAIAASQIFAITAVALGAGVWGLASAAVVKALTGTVLVGALTLGLHPPSLKGWRNLVDVMRFGLKFQLNWIVIVVTDQALNLAVAVVAGLRVLGLWSLANKILQLPLLLFSSLSAVAFPAVSNLLARGEDPSPILVRSARLTSIGGTLVYVPFAAASPELIPLLFGEQWRRAGDIIPLAVLGFLVLGPVSVGSVGYLFALGRPGAVVRASAAGGITGIAVTAALLPFVGVTAIGAGLMCGDVAEALVLDLEMRHTVQIALLRSVPGPAAAATLAGCAGWAICKAGPHNVGVMLAAGAVGLGLDLALLRLVFRRDLAATLAFGFGSIRDAVPRPRAAQEGG